VKDENKNRNKKHETNNLI